VAAVCDAASRGADATGTCKRAIRADEWRERVQMTFVVPAAPALIVRVESFVHSRR